MKSFFNRRGILRSLVLSFALGALGISAGALAAGEGGLRVTITNPDGTPIAEAHVTASSPTSLVTGSGDTNEDGTVILRGLPPDTNYTVVVTAAGFQTYTAENVAVISNKRLDLHYVMGSSVQALGTVVVTGQSLAALDTTSTSDTTVLTLDMVQSLPTGRSYQDYLQLVPAVKPSTSGNPASRSGVNYAMIGGDIGSSTDNVYILDGINVTDPLTGTFGSYLNSEVIRQQVIITGGVPAKYPGGTGLVTRVLTKSGSNEFHGSVSYYFQNASLVADYEHEAHSDFSSYDAAFTLGGPIVKDKLWFFISYQKSFETVDVLDPETEELLRSVDTDRKLGFAKLTYQITQNDRLQVSFFNDPVDISGSDNPQRPNKRDFTQHQGGNNYRVSYSHQWANFALNAYYYKHKFENKLAPKDKAVLSTVAYLPSIPDVTSSDINRGGFGNTSDIYHNSDEYGINAEWWVYTDWGSHDIEFGASVKTNTYKEASHFSNGYQLNAVSSKTYSLINADNPGPHVTLANINDANDDSPSYTGAAPLDPNVAQLFLQYGFANDFPTAANWLDRNGDGTITKTEIKNSAVGKTTGTPYGAVVLRRSLQIPQPYELGSEGQIAYIQDSWTLGQWTTNVGIRAESWAHSTSTGEEFYTFEWTFAPRISVSYDLFGDGTAKVWGFYGRYYDPIRNNMTDFAGSVTANILKSQFFVQNPTTTDPDDGKWVTYRQRGGVGHRDATFVPNTETPYTDELLLGYATTLSAHTSLRVIADYRITKNILEDFNLALYTSPSAGDLRLPYSYFGYPESGPPAGINYFIGTLKGGEREYYGLTVSLTKFRADNWSGKLSYTYNHFEGNTSSDSNADFQGDILALDPRAPNRYGTLPGNIKHMFQAYGSYFFDFGLEVGGVFQWNSGLTYSKTLLALGRHLPLGGLAGKIKPGVVGAYTGPSFWTFDLRLKYNWDLPVGTLHVFMDIFNLFNQQQPRMVQDLATGDATYDFQEPNDWTEPRQFYLGVRYSF